MKCFSYQLDQVFKIIIFIYMVLHYLQFSVT